MGSGARWQSSTVTAQDTPKPIMVTPIAQTIEMAKSELSSADSNVIRGQKRKSYDNKTIFKKDFKTTRQ